MKLALAILVSIVSTQSFAKTEVPINIGLGPAAFYIPEQLEEEEPAPFYGLKIHIKAVIDKELIKKKKNKIPKQYHKMVEKVDEVRVGFILMPDSVMIAPRKNPGGLELYGATWKPISLGVPVKFGSAAKLSLGASIIGTYAYVNSGAYKILDNTEKDDNGNRILAEGETPKYREQVTHFLRPGMDLNANFEIKWSDSFLTSFGWSSAYYLPQKIGGGIGSIGADDLEHSIWRIHQGSFVLHFRVPYEASL